MNIKLVYYLEKINNTLFIRKVLSVSSINLNLKLRKQRLTFIATYSIIVKKTKNHLSLAKMNINLIKQ